MFYKIELLAASLTIWTSSCKAKSKDLNVYTPICPNPRAHSALIKLFLSFETPSINSNSPCAPKFLMLNLATSLTSADLSSKHW